MRVTFFGTAGAVQSQGNGNTSFLVAAAGGGTLLVDASGNPAMHLLRAGSSVCEIDALFLTPIAIPTTSTRCPACCTTCASSAGASR